MRFCPTRRTKIPITSSIFKIQGSSFGFILIFINNDLLFYTPLHEGVGLKDLNSIFFLIFRIQICQEVSFHNIHLFRITGRSKKINRVNFDVQWKNKQTKHSKSKIKIFCSFSPTNWLVKKFSGLQLFLSAGVLLCQSLSVANSVLWSKYTCSVYNSVSHIPVHRL